MSRVLDGTEVAWVLVLVLVLWCKLALGVRCASRIRMDVLGLRSPPFGQATLELNLEIRVNDSGRESFGIWIEVVMAVCVVRHFELEGVEFGAWVRDEGLHGVEALALLLVVRRGLAWLVQRGGLLETVLRVVRVVGASWGPAGLPERHLRLVRVLVDCLIQIRERRSLHKLLISIVLDVSELVVDFSALNT